MNFIKEVRTGFIFLILLLMYPLCTMCGMSKMQKPTQSIVTEGIKHVKPYAAYYGFSQNALPDETWTLTKSKLQSPILNLSRKYEDEIAHIFQNEDDSEKRQLSYAMISGAYSKLHGEQKESLKSCIEDYHTNRYPKISKDLSIITEDKKGQLLRTCYENAYEKYKKENSIGNYYDLTKCLNAHEVYFDTVDPKFQLKDYLFAYAQKHSDSKYYKLKDVQFTNDFYTKSVYGGIEYPTGNYDPISEVVTFFKSFETFTPTEQAFVAMHELEHAAQVHDLYDTSYFSEITRRENETAADLHAVKECNCPVCLKILEKSHVGRRNSDKGYLTSRTFNKYAQQATTRCKAHSQHDTTQLEAALVRGNISDMDEVAELDGKMGTIFDRLPELKK